MTVTKVDDGRRTIVICTNRIEAAARQAERARLAAADQDRIARDATATALSRLRRTRASMMRNGGPEGLTAEQRGRWLTGIDSAIVEMERDVAGRD